MNLKELRKERRLSAPALAKKLGCSTAYIYDIENGRRNFSLAMLGRAEKVFGAELHRTSATAAAQRVKQLKPGKRLRLIWEILELSKEDLKLVAGLSAKTKEFAE